ncbi:ribosomal protein S6 modification protein [Canicola haemoglobinophilus]|uniref:Probable alpha-L-glutamate ligase n=1 Tax=Canicola haemoglobinophilus TaxID=733 RepID=A0A1V4B040_9PAST|nr:RimK family alpha-L-glutamate ligase [Canicola haemoglobinophilus]OOR99378.1 ribosomal protein S6 modification protein [Canicola haemoglobinophilus]STO53593.1 SSU ribosomal protein S6P modification protein [Canicola haemoglobinophilus]STO61000.1 SSU ribosomal protein S6P modification protein [Canicola haemoglobinophilus]STO68127.1 SSU ribosomal protein S6P modification protein [Canicola haemoglobinophilus]
MKLLMLCREPRLYSCQRLKATAEENGHQMDILDPNRCLLKLSQNAPHFELYYQANTESEPYLLPDYDAIIPRFGSASTKMGCAVLRHFRAKNIFCLNDDVAFLKARDKWLSLQLLAEQGIAVPNSVLSGAEFSANQAIKQVETPTILKTLSGSQGIGVILAENRKSAVSIVETLTQAEVPLLMQDFIEEAKGTDIRCFVIGDKVVATMQRIGQEGEFRANFHRGGSAEKIQLTEQEKALALKATKVLGLDVAGVDLIRSKQGLLVLEVNASPGLEMIEKTSGIDIALQMIVHIEKQLAL